MIGEKDIEKVYERLNNKDCIIMPNPMSQEIK